MLISPVLGRWSWGPLWKGKESRDENYRSQNSASSFMQWVLRQRHFGIIARRKRRLVQYKLEFTDVMMSVFYVPKPDAVFV